MYTAYGVGFRNDGSIGAQTPKAQFGGAPKGCSQDSYRYQSQWHSFLGGKGSSYGADSPAVNVTPRQSSAHMVQPVQSAKVSRLLRRR